MRFVGCENIFLTHHSVIHAPENATETEGNPFLSVSVAAYDVPLMRRTLRLLYQAVTEGQLSLIDFYVEADRVYRNLQSQSELECQYQKALTAL